MNGRIWLVALVASAALIMPAEAETQRHQFLEPLQPHHQRPDAPAACYCWTEHFSNAAGLKLWRKVCSERKPEFGARPSPAEACRKGAQPARRP